MSLEVWRVAIGCFMPRGPNGSKHRSNPRMRQEGKGTGLPTNARLNTSPSAVTRFTGEGCMGFLLVLAIIGSILILRASDVETNPGPPTGGNSKLIGFLYCYDFCLDHLLSHFVHILREHILIMRLKIGFSRSAADNLMSEGHRAILAKNSNALCEKLAHADIAKCLVGRDIVTQIEMQTIQTLTTKEMKAGFLLSLLMMKEDGAFYVLIDAFRRCNMLHLAQSLESAG